MRIKKIILWILMLSLSLMLVACGAKERNSQSELQSNWDEITDASWEDDSSSKGDGDSADSGEPGGSFVEDSSEMSSENDSSLENENSSENDSTSENNEWADIEFPRPQGN